MTEQRQDRTDDRLDETRDEAQFADAPFTEAPYDNTPYDSAQVPAGSTDRYAQQVDEPRDAQPTPTARDTYAAVEPTEPFAQNSLQRDAMQQGDVTEQSTSDANRRVDTTVDTAAGRADENDQTAQLFTGEEVDRFRTEWRGLQSDFVDSPRDAVQHADQLVAQVIQSLTSTFADQKRSLEGQWGEGEQVETEELRVALRQYRAFFDKLLTV